ncbi:MAG: hypothetical protein ACKOX2_05755, partial [Microcystaceae cyanobacterium]
SNLAITEKVSFQNLPLAIYREIAAHLRQVSNVQTRLISQSAPQFDYQLSQVEALEISYPQSLPATEKQLLESILAYYAQRYGSYQRSSLTDETV